jgi:membrane protease YdiL (CAAX protease family)
VHTRGAPAFRNVHPTRGQHSSAIVIGSPKTCDDMRCQSTVQLEERIAMTTIRTQHQPAEPETEIPDATPDNPSLRPLIQFAATALPVGWLMLSVPIVTGLPTGPFILATLLFGLVVPSLILTGRETGRAGLKRLLRDSVRLPRPWVWLPVAALALPVAVSAAAAAQGDGHRVTAASLTAWLTTLLSSFIIVNLAEETAWTGFAQRRAIARWGTVRGSLVIALLFAGVHLPLGLAQAENGSDVARGLAILLLTGVGLRLVIACLDGWSGRSLLTIGLLHASFNSTADLADTWTRLTITVAFGLVAATIHRVTRRRSPASTPELDLRRHRPTP